MEIDFMCELNPILVPFVTKHYQMMYKNRTRHLEPLKDTDIIRCVLCRKPVKRKDTVIHTFRTGAKARYCIWCEQRVSTKAGR